ncbi:MAG: nucleoside hydrolase [Anaerolineales bacterium]|nr:nucleoside hydrolase [Anaerolineales bacterium]
MSRSSQWLPVGLIAALMLAIGVGAIGGSWWYTTSRLQAARALGVFSSPAEGMRALTEADYVGLQEVQIRAAQETTALGGGPHVWFVTVCVWAEARADGSPVGNQAHDFDFGGSYFVNVSDGWVLLPESAQPLFVAFWMPLFDLAGDDRVAPVADSPGLPTRSCVRADYPPLEPGAPRAVAAGAQPVIVDTDMAADDWLAILYLLGRSDVDLQAITVTGAGEARCAAGTRNALNLLALAGRPEIPVACGRETPLFGDHAFPLDWRDRVDSLLGLALPENSAEPASETAVALLRRLIAASPQPVHLVTLGPLTNVGELLEADPSLVTNLEMITVMGGAVKVGGNVGPSSDINNKVAEWNIYVDPHAAALVLASGAPVTLAPLDATNTVPLTTDFLNRLRYDRATPVAEFVYRVLSAQGDTIRRGGYYFWDPLAAALATDAGLATVQELSLTVVEEEGAESGRTVESASGAGVQVALAADRARFETLFLDAINGRKP